MEKIDKNFEEMLYDLAVEKYNQLDFYEHENKMRKLLQTFLDPIIK